MLSYELIQKFAGWTAGFIAACLVGCATVPGENVKQAETAAGQPAGVTTAASSADKRQAIEQEIVQNTLAAMAASNDAVAVALSAKSVRLAGVESGKTRTTIEQDGLQAAAMRRAMTLAESIQDIAKRDETLAFVRFVLANQCAGLPNQPFCLERNPLFQFVNNHPTNTYGWMLFAATEFAMGRNMETGILLKRASNESALDWHYSQAMEIGLRYARSVGPSISASDKAGVVESAAFTVAGEMPLPPFHRFSQMCNPDPEGKLPDGRYEVCRMLANRMITFGKSNIEVIVGLRALERMALGEKKDAEARDYGNQLADFQARINMLWKEKLTYPPTNPKEAVQFAAFLDEMILVGERRATEYMQKKLGISTKLSAAK